MNSVWEVFFSKLKEFLTSKQVPMRHKRRLFNECIPLEPFYTGARREPRYGRSRAVGGGAATDGAKDGRNDSPQPEDKRVARRDENSSLDFSIKVPNSPSSFWR